MQILGCMYVALAIFIIIVSIKEIIKSNKKIIRLNAQREILDIVIEKEKNNEIEIRTANEMCSILLELASK